MNICNIFHFFTLFNFILSYIFKNLLTSIQQSSTQFWNIYNIMKFEKTKYFEGVLNFHLKILFKKIIYKITRIKNHMVLVYWMKLRSIWCVFSILFYFLQPIHTLIHNQKTPSWVFSENFVWFFFNGIKFFFFPRIFTIEMRNWNRLNIQH